MIITVPSAQGLILNFLDQAIRSRIRQILTEQGHNPQTDNEHGLYAKVKHLFEIGQLRVIPENDLTCREVRPGEIYHISNLPMQRVDHKPIHYSKKKYQEPEAPEPAPLVLENNYVDVSYFYADGKGVEGTKFDVIDAMTNNKVKSGTIGASGTTSVDLPGHVKQVEVLFYDDPEDVADVRDSQPKISTPTPPGWLARVGSAFEAAWEGTQDAASWTWGTLQGDFNESPSTSQIITNTVLTMIPVVDQVGDVRDIGANLKILVVDKRYNEIAAWLGLFFCLVGLIPTLGSLLKGIFKLIYRGAKLDELLKVFNFFKKGNGVKWLKALKDGKLHQYADEAANLGKDILDAISGKLEELQGLIPGSFAKAQQQISGTLKTLQILKGKINQMFANTADNLVRKLDNILIDHKTVPTSGSAKGNARKYQNDSPPPKVVTNRMNAPASFGKSSSTAYKKTFFAKHPDKEGKVVVHHAVEQQVQKRYPDLVSDSEMHSLENLRGIPNEINSDVHLSKIRKEWNRFYRQNPNPTKQQLLDKATEIDDKFGHLFDPPIR